ncbi:MAG: hypothetical protein WKF84_24820 [Pyrinomonadaceae bacterium]
MRLGVMNVDNTIDVIGNKITPLFLSHGDVAAKMEVQLKHHKHRILQAIFGVSFGSLTYCKGINHVVLEPENRYFR